MLFLRPFATILNSQRGTIATIRQIEKHLTSEDKAFSLGIAVNLSVDLSTLCLTFKHLLPMGLRSYGKSTNSQTWFAANIFNSSFVAVIQSYRAVTILPCRMKSYLQY